MNDTLKNNTMYFPEIPFGNSPGYEGILTNESPTTITYAPSGTGYVQEDTQSG
jgi:hypothetical protein